MALTVEKAERKSLPLKLLVSGPPGSGKTYGSLLIAAGYLGGKDLDKIFLIDTEHRSSLEYADIFGDKRWQLIEVAKPFDPRIGVEAIQLALKQGAKLIILDSLYHFWHGEGGILEMKDKVLKSREFKQKFGSNEFAVWQILNPIHNSLVQDAIINCPVPVICTCRSDMEYEIQEVNGKKRPTKIGLMPKQRKGIDYEFRAHIEIDGRHVATLSKGSKRLQKLIEHEEFLVAEATGKAMAKWLSEDTGE